MSLRKYLLVSILLILSGVGGLAIWSSYRASVYEVNELFDAQLSRSARLMLGLAVAEIQDGHVDEMQEMILQNRLRLDTLEKGDEEDGHEASEVGHYYELKLAFQGRYIKARPAGDKKDDIAFDATFRAAAPFQKKREEKRKRLAFAIESSDLQRKIRVKRVANLVLFLVDASWSMAVAERMNATKGAILSLLTDAYQRRDRVGLIVFQKDRATLVLPPTNSVQLAQRALMDIPVGGKTPLSAGLFLAADVLRQEKIHHPDIEPLLIVLTDGAGNVSIGALPPQEESYRFAELIAHEKVNSVVINMEHAAFDQGLAQQLANHLKAPCYALSELKAESLYHTVKGEMAKPAKK